jgi:hypothetical protein
MSRTHSAKENTNSEERKQRRQRPARDQQLRRIWIGHTKNQAFPGRLTHTANRLFLWLLIRILKRTVFFIRDDAETVRHSGRNRERNKAAVRYHTIGSKGRQRRGWITGQSTPDFFLSPHGKNQASKEDDGQGNMSETTNRAPIHPPLPSSGL